MGFDEVDAWYEDEKARLTEDYRKGLVKGRDKERLKARFDQRLSALAKEYEMRNGKVIRSELRRKRIGHKVEMILKPLRDRLSLLMERFSKKKEEGKD